MSFLGTFAAVAVLAVGFLLGLGLFAGFLFNLFGFYEGDGTSSLIIAAGCLLGLLMEISVVVTLAGGLDDHRPVCGYDHHSKGGDTAVHCDEPTGSR